MHVGRRDSFFTLLISLYYHASFADNETLTADRDALAVELADKNAELARMRALLEQYHIPVNA